MPLTVADPNVAREARFGLRRLAAAFGPEIGKRPDIRSRRRGRFVPSVRTFAVSRNESGGKPPHSKAAAAAGQPRRR
jgi:hypothetical protein